MNPPSALHDLIEETRESFRDDPLVYAVVKRLLIAGARAGIHMLRTSGPAATRKEIERLEKSL